MRLLLQKHRGLGVLCLLGIVGVSVLQAGLASAEVTRKGSPRAVAGDVLQIAELSAFTAFAPNLPDALPAQFRFMAPIAGTDVTITVDKHSCRSDTFKVLVDGGDGKLTRVADPVVRTYKGAIANRPGTIVTGSLLESGFSGIVHLEDGTDWAIQPLSDFRRDVTVGDPRHIAYAASDAIPDGRGCAFGRRGFERFGVPPVDGGGAGGDEGGLAGGTPGQVTISCETDHEFFQKNSSSVVNTVNDVELIISNVNTIYDRDANVTHELGTIVIRSNAADPYNGTTIDARLDEFGNKWASAPESGIFRNISHFFSGYNYSGGTIGLAYLGGVCAGINATQYGVVESRYTTALAFRISLSTHELGHNWDCTHCDSQGSANCNIMCSSNGGCGGISGSNLRLNTFSVSELNTWRNQVSCDFVRPVAVTPPFTETFTTTSLSTDRFTYSDGASVNTAAQNEPTAPYSLNLNSTGSNTYDDDEVRTNTINLAGTNSATAAYKVQRIGVESGKTFAVEYLNNSLDWTPLNTITSDGSNQTTFTNFEHALPANARHAAFRLRFRPDGTDSTDNWYVDDISVFTVATPPAPANDECVAAITINTGNTTFNTSNATDTALPVPTTCTANGDGVIVKDIWYKYVAPVSGSTTVSTCGLASFNTRIAVYGPVADCPGISTTVRACNDDGTGCASGTSSVAFTSLIGATYYLRVGGATAGGTGTLAVTAIDCAADLNNDLFTDAADLAAMLANWNNSGQGDLDSSGTVDGSDLAALLGAWGPCN
ncbi:MAG: hypothetical protein FJ285_02730 [Planctomycetes bacterium]|nr:hypothetical protein [Planctomycetota bacterium]